jgi:hypothetical protein
VYWNVLSPAEWERRKAEAAASQARRRQVAERAVDAVDLSDPQSEKSHNFQGERTNEGFFESRKWRDAWNGWFSYDLKVTPDSPVILMCTVRGSEGRQRTFDVFVDGERIATRTLEYHPTEFLDLEIPIPDALTRGKQRVTVKFQAQPNTATGAVFDLRILPQ